MGKRNYADVSEEHSISIFMIKESEKPDASKNRAASTEDFI
jgi:hypothetical protein